jgi:phospholipid/cholesterol/gamma-HCH transport system substrate-binding protein
VKKVLTPFRVGLLVLASAGFLFFWLSFVKKGGMDDKEAIRVFAYFRDASGLGPKSRVQVAGIAVGEIETIELEGIRAKVWLKIRRSVGLREDASLTKRSESLLGDYQLDLYPGSEKAEVMPENGQIKRVIDAQGMEQIFNSLSAITADIQQVTSSLREVLGGEKGAGSLQAIVENLIKLSETVDTTVRESAEKLAAILKNFEGVSNDVRGITQGEENNIRHIVENVDKITSDTRDVLVTVKKIVGSGEGDLKESVSSLKQTSLKQTLNRLDNTLANLEEVTGKVAKGEGAAGVLLTDKRMGQKLSDTVEDLSDFAGRLTTLQTEVGMKSDFLFEQGTAKNSLQIRLIPKPDKYYILELVDDPRGVVEQQTVQSNPPSVGQPVTQVQTTTREGLKVSAQFAKRYYFTTIRFGIIESTGGVGADVYWPTTDALSLKIDAFNFSVQELRYPRLRVTGRWQPMDHMFINAGVDDIFNRGVRDLATNRLIAGRDIFFGAGIFFTDDDLKAVLTAAPSLPTQ